MYESRRQGLLSRAGFARRFAKSLGFAGAILAGALAIGVLGYHTIAGLGWVDSVHNASMILTGMGPVDRLGARGAKLFASCYALFSGVVFLTTIAVALAPVLHRVLHTFHIDEADLEGKDAE